MGLAEYQDKLERLSVNSAHGRSSPHKICMLLSVFDLVRAGALDVNQILYAPPLLERYARYFDAVASPGDIPNPYFPFFHLTGKLRSGAGRDRESFWHLTAKPGQEEALARMSSARRHRDIIDIVAFASLDPELFELLRSPSTLEALSETLSVHWFGRLIGDLAGITKQLRTQSDYERTLRAMEHGSAPPQIVPERPIRSAAFRRVVLQNYDFRCAASGLRVVLADGQAMVQAAHIKPFAEAADDDPRNGMALTPDMHWAMDNNLIAPDPDYRWRVSPRLDDRILDFQHLVALAGKTMFLPRNPQLYPKREYLELRYQRMTRPEVAPSPDQSDWPG